MCAVHDDGANWTGTVDNDKWKMIYMAFATVADDAMISPSASRRRFVPLSYNVSADDVEFMKSRRGTRRQHPPLRHHAHETVTGNSLGGGGGVAILGSCGRKSLGVDDEGEEAV
ncbi:hypothetical protein L249_1493 [Ophiocordyceps polyrhachis-furcata BCC 54312]|uniref:Uncharacterized protein n=1 Tax=Ophiocordyceps polyrhachis-furcata BCC 54312 TaxID=1330021 RepID=A0A367L4D4_9HYPO|nr:hypothetical protein L249_1493 [Ophiocordyceps polyrhachis-furcata BCC 54312]